MEPKVAALSQANLMEIVGKLVPADYLTSGSGSEIVYAICKVGERLSLAVKRLFDGLTPGTAPFGSLGTGTILISRENAAIGGTLETGTIFRSINGDKIALTADVTWAVGDVAAKTGTVVSLMRSYQSNLASGTIVGVSLPVPAPLFDTTIIGTVVSISSGVSPMLETLAAERNLGKQTTFETLQSLRLRLRTLEDVVTPNAIEKIAQASIQDAELIEAWDTVAFSDYAWWTDGSYSLTDGNGLNNRLAYTTCTGWFYICVPLLVVSVQDMIWLCDDYGHTDYQDGYCANTLLADDGIGGTYDMGDWGLRTDVQSMAGKIDLAKAGGVFWFIEEV